MVLIEGTAEMAADHPDLLHWATRIGVAPRLEVIDIELLWMLIPVVLGVVGAVLLVVGVRNFVRTRRFVNHASSTTGTVTDVKTRTSRSRCSTTR